MFEFVGNVYGLFGMELYSCSLILKTQKDVKFITCLDDLLTVDTFVSFLHVFDTCQIDMRLPRLDRYIQTLTPPITWWKTLLVTFLSTSPELGIKGFTPSEMVAVVVKILESISNLVS